jgi:hypothetical protein
MVQAASNGNPGDRLRMVAVAVFVVGMFLAAWAANRR